MKLVKGMMIGAVTAVGITMLYMESTNKTKKNLMKKGKQMVRKMGII